jgi:hypothetical protein
MILEKTGLNRTGQTLTAYLSDEQKDDITFFIQQLLNKWCADSQFDFHPVLFSKRLFGGKKFNWDETPLKALDDWYKANPKRKTEDNTPRTDVGHALWNVLINDDRVFYTDDTTVDGNRPYWWLNTPKHWSQEGANAVFH